ncbi:hypothetical protein EG329_006601 [Mollisiaceae sp. DMI_Dod_QoI]|nr:hypothetical protein EG329_006601 [Helotiales sp. DMI_Dod_QoI]
MLPIPTRENNAKAGTPPSATKCMDNTPQLQLATTPTLTPAPLNASDGPSERRLLQKRHRRNLDPLEKLEVAAVRKRGACKECRRRKEKCRHAIQQLAIDEFGTDGDAPALQRSESQDSCCSVGSSVYSEMSNFGQDCLVATSVIAGPSLEVDQLLIDPLDWVNSIVDSDNRCQGCVAETPSMQVYSTSATNGVVLPDSYLSLDQMSQDGIVSQNSSHLSTRENGTSLISSPTMSFSTGQREPWSHITQSDGGNNRNSEYLANLQSYTLSSGKFQQPSALSDACMIHQEFMEPPMRPQSRGCYACNAVVSEKKLTYLQPGMNTSIRRSSYFDGPSSSGIRDQTIPDHLFYNNMPPNGPFPQSFGSSVDMRIPSFIPENARYSSWDSYPLPSQMQDGFQGISMNQIAVNMFKPCYHSQVTFGTNSSPQYGRNTFGGYELPSSSINEITAMTIPSTREFLQNPTGVIYSPPPMIADQDFPLLCERLSLSSQQNCSFVNFPQPSPPISVNQSDNVLLSRGRKCDRCCQ